jgi:hypothetical protein
LLEVLYFLRLSLFQVMYYPSFPQVTNVLCFLLKDI